MFCFINAITYVTRLFVYTYFQSFHYVCMCENMCFVINTTSYIVANSITDSLVKTSFN